MPLNPEPVTTDLDIELVRLIRNAGSALLSHDNREVSKKEQAAYWREHGHTIRAWLYLDDDCEVVGAGSLRRSDDGRLWAWVGVEAWAQGHHYSVEIIRHLISEAGDEPVWGRNRMDNPPATYLCVDSGIWRMMGREGQVIIVAYYRSDQPSY